MLIPKFISRKNLIQYKELFSKIQRIDKDFSGTSPPGIFIGSKLPYPYVNVGILSPPEIREDAWLYDAQNYWAKENFNIEKVIELRSGLINSRIKANVFDARKNNKFLETIQEIGMSNKIVDVEIELKKRLNVRVDFDNLVLPMGPRGQLKSFKITENPKIPDKVEKVVDDKDLKANEAINYLYKSDYDEHFLSKLLSVGVLGLGKSRRLVPTRWSITAVDDTIGKQLLGKIRDYSLVNEYRLYFGKFMGNYYLIMLFPERFSYELFELYLPKSSWNQSDELKVATDYESFDGRKNYASNTVGGYYASRIAVLESLEKIKKQASVLVLRFETPEYWAALGVWVVRSAARKTLEEKGMFFNNKEQMLEYAKNLILANLNYNIHELLKRSILLEKIKTQMKLLSFI